MASSRKPRRSSPSADLVARVAARLKTIVQPGHRVLLALSGGVDSVVLLDVLARLAPRMRFVLEALHINHQLSPHAASWARYCRALCRHRGVACRVVKVDVEHGNSTERSAREARYAALQGARAEHVMLAHNQDDQAETVLLQLLRGAGVKGLAAMPLVKKPDLHRARPSIVRPLLDVSRAQIERYAMRRKLEWIEDESNADVRYTRNWMRREILPRIEARVPGYREVLARAAAHLGEAAALLDDLARLDSQDWTAAGGIDVKALQALTPARARNAMRFVIAQAGWRMPQAARLAEALRQALHARAGAKVAVNLGSCELRRHGGAVYLLPIPALVESGGSGALTLSS